MSGVFVGVRLFFVLVVVSMQTHAADFRALSFGASCDQIHAYEQSQGSSREYGSSNPDVIWFTGRAFERSVDIGYLCPNNLLTAGHFVFPPEHDRDAAASFRSVYDALRARYRQPFLDNTPWQDGAETIDPRGIASHPRKYYVSWRSSETWVTLALMPGQEPTTGLLRVFVVIKPLQSTACTERGAE